MAGTLGTPTITALGGTRVMYDAGWTATTGGAVSGNTLTLEFPGRLRHVVFDPSTDCTDALDFTLLTTGGVDLLNGQGLNSTNGEPTWLQFDPAPELESVSLVPTIADAGNATTGSVRIVISE